MNDEKRISMLNESLTRALCALVRVYEYAPMDMSTLEIVRDALHDAETTLQLVSD